MKLVLVGTLENISTRVDGSVKVSFITQEIDESNGAQLFALRNKFLKCLFSDSNITNLEAEAVDKAEMAGSKKRSQSQRLRGVLFKQYEQAGLKITFDDFYRTRMEEIIETEKLKLNDNDTGI